MPDTYGKRERRKTQERKAAQRDERRATRKERRQAGLPGIPDVEPMPGPAPHYEDTPKDR